MSALRQRAFSLLLSAFSNASLNSQKVPVPIVRTIVLTMRTGWQALL